MRKLLVLCAVFLAACADQTPPKPQEGGLRSVTGPIYSSAGFLSQRAAGQWHQAASFSAGGQNCAAGRLELRPTRKGLFAKGALCLNGQIRPIEGELLSKGMGRFAFAGMSDWWVLWVDHDYRTMAIGTPDGSFGFLLDRGALPYDRRVAAAEVFDFNGYSKTQLRNY